jgi:hypothetical protein
MKGAGFDKHDIDQALLTAYALGELDADEQQHARVDDVIATDPHAAAFVDEVRAISSSLSEELGAEPVDRLSELHREVIERRLQEVAQAERLRRQRVLSLRRNRWVPWAVSLAASIAIVGGVAVVLSRMYPNHQPGPRAGDPNSPAVAVVPPEKSQQASPDAGNPDEDAMADGTEWEPGDVSVEDSVDLPPHAVPPQPAPKKVASANPGEKRTAVAPPAPPTPAPPKVAIGPARSSEAEAVRSGTVRATPPKPAPGKTGRRSVNVSPPRDPEAFKKVVKSASDPNSASTTPTIFENPFRLAANRPHSSFPVRVEDSSYRSVRKHLLERERPPAYSVRIEELLNHFSYRDPAPEEGGAPVMANVEVAACPWNVAHRLARVALKARSGGATVVARHVEVSVDFGPEAAAWRLIGYENAPATSEHPATFPADLAAGGAATALYEILPVSREPRTSTPRPLFNVMVTYRDASDRAAGLQRFSVPATDAGNGFDRAGEDFRFASAVASFGMLLRDSRFKGTATYADVIRWASSGKGADETRERAAFIDLARVARDLR